MKIKLELEVGVETAVVVSALESHSEMMKQAGSNADLYVKVGERLAKTVQQKIEETKTHPGWPGQRGGMIVKGQCPP